MKQVYYTLSDFQKDYNFDFSDPKTHLGEGSYGEVVKAFDKNNNTWVALKRSKSSNTDLQKEFDAAKDLNHPNIAKYQSCYRLSDPNVGIREYAIIKLYECNLNHIINNVKLANLQTHELVKSILLGLEYLHNNKKIHRDFKPGNILISTLPNGNYTAHITDFGLTKIVGTDDLIDGSDVMLSDGRGTASYKAPEQVEGEKAYYNMDLWAFGVILFELLTRERPFKRATIGSEKQRDNELFLQIKNVIIPNTINQILEPYQSIIRRCLVKDIHKRVRKESELLDLLDNIPQLLKQAQQFNKNGQYKLAIKNYENILHLRPDNQEAKNGLSNSKQAFSLVNEPKTDYANYSKKATQSKTEEPTDDGNVKENIVFTNSKEFSINEINFYTAKQLILRDFYLNEIDPDVLFFIKVPGVVKGFSTFKRGFLSEERNYFSKMLTPLTFENWFIGMEEFVFSTLTVGNKCNIITEVVKYSEIEAVDYIERTHTIDGKFHYVVDIFSFGKIKGKSYQKETYKYEKKPLIKNSKEFLEKEAVKYLNKFIGEIVLKKLRNDFKINNKVVFKVLNTIKLGPIQYESNTNNGISGNQNANYNDLILSKDYIEYKNKKILINELVLTSVSDYSQVTFRNFKSEQKSIFNFRQISFTIELEKTMNSRFLFFFLEECYGIRFN